MKIDQYDSLLQNNDWLARRDLPVALTLTEILEPVGGPEAVIFPPTYARRGGDNPYAISNFDSNLSPQEAAKTGRIANNCDIDSVGSQGNRMEDSFIHGPLGDLVPQIVIKAGSQVANLLSIGHRIADGAVRFSGLAKEVASVIEELAKNHDASKIARLAPTSLIFGFWNSREKDHQLAIKYPRILSSIIRATNVAVLKRSAQFNPAFDPAAILNGAENTESATPSEQESREKDEKDPLSQEGLRAAPAVDTHGGVRVFGQISRQTEVNLVGLRALAVVKGDKTDEGETLKLRRYLLGLALVAGRAQESYNLRQGCSLVLKDGLPVEAKAVRPSGQRESFTWDFGAAYAFAEAAAKDFGTFATPNRDYNFDPKQVNDVLKAKDAKKAGKKKEKTA